MTASLDASARLAAPRRRAFLDRRRLLRLPGLRRVWGGHSPVPASQPDVDEHGQLVQ
jgi:hypothetical protein